MILTRFSTIQLAETCINYVLIAPEPWPGDGVGDLPPLRRPAHRRSRADACRPAAGPALPTALSRGGREVRARAHERVHN